MRNISTSSDNIIHGKCSLFACRCCRTKYGWEHQRWCELSSVTEPACEKCRYYSGHNGRCAHPAKKIRKEFLLERNAIFFGINNILNEVIQEFGGENKDKNKENENNNEKKEDIDKEMKNNEKINENNISNISEFKYELKLQNKVSTSRSYKVLIVPFMELKHEREQ